MFIRYYRSTICNFRQIISLLCVTQTFLYVVDSIISECVSDVVFAVDHSGSMGPENHPAITAFIKNIVNNVTIGPSNVQIGYEYITNGNGTKFYLNTFTAKGDVNNALDSIQYV